MLRRREFLKTAAVLAAGRAAWPAPARKANILFLLASQLRAPALEMDEESDLRTPNLERLAKQGARFDRLYASCPVGSPSLAAFITGRYPFSSGVTRENVRLPLDQPSIAATGWRTRTVRATGTSTPWISVLVGNAY